MIIKVKTEKENTIVPQLIRTEDIQEVYENPYDADITVIVWYDHDRDNLEVVESFKAFGKRFIKMELDYLYEDGDEFDSDEELINKINE